ncbi:LOW QUALITY PROTEIN: calpain-C [Cydia pomonella]|uniref:LOW QUALITY PROTEIN: calpain-C n=1 Tax=Cydia pomonella TaxID=82600 RepID=UPI002ADDAB81|nr:LOW QUALITY PROTEIN: calpain-C [Cydia pomonella]
MTDYEKIKAECQQRGQLWEDPDFPAAQASVFYHQTPPFHFVWKRAKEIYTDPTFVRDNCDIFDVVPGKLGDKWLVSCLSVLFLSKGLLYRVVPADQRVDAGYAGIFRFRIWWCGQWLEVLVDDRLPTVNGKLAFLQTSSTEQLWPALLEKAYAKLHGSYEALKYGSLLDGMADLTGGITESQLVRELSDGHALANLLRATSVVTAHYQPSVSRIYSTKVREPTRGHGGPDRRHHRVPTVRELSDGHALANLLRATSVVTAHYQPSGVEQRGLEPEMNYRVYSCEDIVTDEGLMQQVRLRRPLTSRDSQRDEADRKITNADRERLNAPSIEFTLSFVDFQRLFHRVETVHLDAETSWPEPTLADKMKWQVKMHQGAWRRGVTAGGCRNYVHFFHMNPQIQIVVSETDTLVVSLNQHSVMEPKVIGFSIYKLPKLLVETATPNQFKKLKSTVNSQYTNSRQVSHRCDLQPGSYLIMPTTFEPREEANFSLRIFSTKTIRMRALDSAPQMIKAAVIRAPPGLELSRSVSPEHEELKQLFAQYEAIFLQLADEHRTIDAFELQELLDACLPNDYIKSCASIDTCKQIVLSLDKTGTGRISLANFKDLMCSLKHWQMVFKAHAREKMGVLLAERLRDALREVGFVVPDRAMTLLLLRYMRKDGMLRFGDFVSTVMHLHRAFNVFYTNAATSNYINLNLSEWLKCALTC